MQNDRCFAFESLPIADERRVIVNHKRWPPHLLPSDCFTFLAPRFPAASTAYRRTARIPCRPAAVCSFPITSAGSTPLFSSWLVPAPSVTSSTRNFITSHCCVRCCELWAAFQSIPATPVPLSRPLPNDSRPVRLFVFFLKDNLPGPA